MKKFSLLLAAILLCGLFASCTPVSEDESSSSSVSSTDSSDDLPAYEFTYNRYALSSDVEQLLGGSLETYHSAVDAIDSVSDSFAVSDEAEAELLEQVLYACYPPASLVTDMTYDPSSKSVRLTYRYPAAVMEQRLPMLEQLVVKIMGLTLREGDSEVVRAVALYKYVTTGVVDSGDDSKTVWNAFFDGEGDSAAMSAMCRFLFAQAGISSIPVTATDHDGNEHSLLAAEFGGMYYLIDPAYEAVRTSGQGLVCFGTTEQQSNKENYLTDFAVSLPGIEMPSCTDERFASMRNCGKWSLNSTRDVISMTADEYSGEFTDTADR